MLIFLLEVTDLCTTSEDFSFYFRRLGSADCSSSIDCWSEPYFRLHIYTRIDARDIVIRCRHMTIWRSSGSLTTFLRASILARCGRKDTARIVRSMCIAMTETKVGENRVRRRSSFIVLMLHYYTCKMLINEASFVGICLLPNTRTVNSASHICFNSMNTVIVSVPSTTLLQAFHFPESKIPQNITPQSRAARQACIFVFIF